MLLDREAKERMMYQLGVDILILLPFTLKFAQLCPEDFIKDILMGQLRAKGIIVGYNYTFGHKGKGTPETLWKHGEEYGYSLNVIPPVKVAGQVVSSSLIRTKLSEGDVIFARQLLGYNPFTEGVVVSGERRGNTLGFPTANIECPDGMVVPCKGVYRVQVEVEEDTYLGVANIGTKPTFNGHSQRTNIEVHLLDFCGNLYGKKIKVSYTRRLRDERKFASITELVNQIQADVQSARFDHPE
nr:riboflavin biosynthesis protein RibF [Desulforamulus aquiferis]